MSDKSQRKRGGPKRSSVGSAAGKSPSRKAAPAQPAAAPADTTDSPAAPETPSPPAVVPKDRTTPDFPCICPDEKYPITRAVCLGRQERGYPKCAACRYHVPGQRQRRDRLKER